MLKIININWLSKEALEAEVTLTDGDFELICFSHPFNYSLNDKINEHLYCYEVNNISKEQIGKFNVTKLNSTFAYKLTGKLINKKESLVTIGDIIIELEKDTLPNDLIDNDYISFTSQRIDLY